MVNTSRFIKQQLQYKDDNNLRTQLKWNDKRQSEQNSLQVTIGPLLSPLKSD